MYAQDPMFIWQTYTYHYVSPDKQNDLIYAVARKHQKLKHTFHACISLIISIAT